MAQTHRELLQDILRHLDGGSPLYPGALIFEEDKPAVEVIREALTEANPANVYSRHPHRSA